MTLVPRLELPIDHFRLLGVGPSVDAQGVLNMLQQRLARVPEKNFSNDTLRARDELLRSTADLLSDGERRIAYETHLTTLAATGDPIVPALEIPTSKEVAGLLLLLEAGQPLECFDLASKCLQPPQAPVLGSSREADLALIAGLACLDACHDYQHQRRFEAAARLLKEGLHLLQRMGQRPELREAITLELDRLTPYRVLDLLSRDLGAVKERNEGLELLEQLVVRRGGLEANADPAFSREDFQSFFKQIRGFLTVQEQVDLFSRWGDAGSAAADFLATTALTASGFAQRKPERIAAARDRLQASGRSGIEPLLANLQLLLGQVDLAKASFRAGASQELQSWAARQSEDPLGQLCSYCRDWLVRDVLPGYRDLDADPDLDAYFSDRDVLAYVEREDRRTGSSNPSSAEDANRSGMGAAGWSFDEAWRTSFYSRAGRASDGAETARAESSGVQAGEENLPHRRGIALPPWRQLPLPWVLASVGALASLLLGAAWLLRPRPMMESRGVPTSGLPGQPSDRGPGDGTKPAMKKKVSTSSPSGAKPAGPEAVRSPSNVPQPQSPPTDTTADQGQAVPLKSPEPTERQIQSLLESWLKAKSTVLAGRPPSANLGQMAREPLIAVLETERNRYRLQNQIQAIDAQVKSLSITDRSSGRIVARAEVLYSDSLRNAEGREINRTLPKTLRNVYVFCRDNGTWRLAAYRAAN